MLCAGDWAKYGWEVHPYEADRPDSHSGSIGKPYEFREAAGRVGGGGLHSWAQESETYWFRLCHKAISSEVIIVINH